MAPVFSKAAWRCVWHMIQVHQFVPLMLLRVKAVLSNSDYSSTIAEFTFSTQCCQIVAISANSIDNIAKALLCKTLFCSPFVVYFTE
jgi:hypothetical protein